MLYRVLQVRHEHQISSLEPAVVQRVVVDVTEDGACADAVRHVFLVDVLAQAVHVLFSGIVDTGTAATLVKLGGKCTDM